MPFASCLLRRRDERICSSTNLGSRRARQIDADLEIKRSQMAGNWSTVEWYMSAQSRATKFEGVYLQFCFSAKPLPSSSPASSLASGATGVSTPELS